MNVHITCPSPGCGGGFLVAEESIGELEDEEGADRVTCPHCLREMDPWAERRRAEDASQAISIDDVVVVRRREDGRHSVSRNIAGDGPPGDGDPVR